MTKEFRRRASWPNFKVISRHLRGGTEENHEKHEDNLSSGLDFNPGLPKYEAVMLTTFDQLLCYSC
jgi:hypothetical protein